MYEYNTSTTTSISTSQGRTASGVAACALGNAFHGEDYGRRYLESTGSYVTVAALRSPNLVF
ncbi:hypothetical protein H1W00_11470 [Aeromicrobium sp. Marseille-Q0843]|uniref:Uncharacterized protein n=1 Tax=Aeromicrobium phoceense TaxID=2754045 RepID=A0A838XGX7_9ACTN|nr:hypothetical protein [Aeromicrobium phoceense]MBA4609097.1 hypothetical protein [Aeromicrobium phoceense]